MATFCEDTFFALRFIICKVIRAYRMKISYMLTTIFGTKKIIFIYTTRLYGSSCNIRVSFGFQIIEIVKIYQNTEVEISY